MSPEDSVSLYTKRAEPDSQPLQKTNEESSPTRRFFDQEGAKGCPWTARPGCLDLRQVDSAADDRRFAAEFLNV